MIQTVHVGHAPRGRRPIPYGWPERLSQIVFGCLTMLYILGLS